jgi:Domain of unknown function (DUF4129)
MSCSALLRGCSLFLLLFAFLCDRSWGSVLSLHEYRSSIQEALSQVDSRKGRLESEESAFFDEHFPSHLEVNTKAGEPVQVDNGPLLGLVKQAQETDEGRETLIVHLKALRSQIAFVDKPVPLSEEGWSESLDRLNKVFSAKEFQNLEEAKDPAWMVFLQEFLRKVLEWMARHRGAINSSGDWLEYVFYGVILGGVFILVFWIVRTLGPVGWRFRDLRVKPVQERKASGMDWKTLREESRHHGEKGEYREAIRLFFISALMEGHERGWWVYRREATNREHLSDVEGSTERKEALERMIQVYENTWYGHESPGKDALQRCSEWLRLMEAG